MLPHSLRTRGVTFAFLFGPPRMVERQEASRVHNGVCDELSLDDLTFRYSSAEPGVAERSRGFSIRLERQEGRGLFLVVIDQTGAGNLMRLLLEYRWPPSDMHVSERFDIASQAVFQALDGNWQRVMAEARIRAQCDVRDKDSLRYLSTDLLRINGQRAEALGSPLTFASVGLHAYPSTPTEDPLDSPSHELTVEILREDPGALYLEMMTRWTQVPVGVRGIEIGSTRPIDQKPSEYIQAGRKAMNHWIDTMSAEEPV